jgi:hypothetical protein
MQPEVHPFTANNQPAAKDDHDSFLHQVKIDLNRKNEPQKDKDDSIVEVQELYDSLKGINKRVEKLEREIIHSPLRMLASGPGNAESGTPMDLELPFSPILDTKKNQDNKTTDDDINKFFQ